MNASSVIGGLGKSHIESVYRIIGNQSTQYNYLNAFCEHLFKQWDNKFKRQKEGKYRLEGQRYNTVRSSIIYLTKILEVEEYNWR